MEEKMANSNNKPDYQTKPYTPPNPPKTPETETRGMVPLPPPPKK